MNPHFNATILKSVMKNLEIDVNSSIPKNTIINLQIGVKITTNYEYLNYGNYVVQKCDYNADTNSYSCLCYDKMLYSMKEYTTLQNGTFPMTVREYIGNLCLDLGLTFKNQTTTFANYDKVISSDLYANLGYTYRDIFDELSEVTASIICLDEDDLVEIRYINDTNDTINEDYFPDTNVAFGEKYGPVNSIVLSRTAESDNVYLQDETSVSQNGLCEIKIIDNQIMNNNDRSDYLPDILEKLDGLEYYINDFSSTGILYYELCDRYNVQIREKTYSCILFNDDIKMNQGLSEDIYTEKPKTSITDYTKADKTDRRINQAYIIMNKQKQQLESLISQVGDRSEKSTSITQDIDSIVQQVSQIETLTSDLTQNSSLTIEDAFEGEIVKFSISGNMSLLYPSDDLYPSNDLYPLDSYLIIQYKDETQDKIHLPLNYLRYLNATAYDEFIVENGQAKIIRRVGENEDGSFYALTSEIEEDKGDLVIELKEGYNKLWLESFFDLPLKYSARYVAQNDYTSLFATKVEMHSEISQTASEINLEVAKKVDENEVIAAINLTSETATIHANKLSLEGYTTINEGFSVDEEGNMIAKNGTFTGGLITLNDNSELVSQSGNFKISNESNGRYTQLNTMGMFVDNPNGEESGSYGQQGIELYLVDGTGYNSVWITQFMAGKGSYYVPGIMLSRQGVSQGASATQITSERILTPELTQNSLAEFKKNFEKLENALKIVEETDIYKYHFKSQKDDDKKHIGFIIGNDYNYSQEITSSKNDGVDLYSMIAVCFKAIQEQELKIKKLEAKWRS